MRSGIQETTLILFGLGLIPTLDKKYLSNTNFCVIILAIAGLENKLVPLQEAHDGREVVSIILFIAGVENDFFKT